MNAVRKTGKVLKKLDENKTLALELYNLTNEMDFRKGYIAFAEAMERFVNKIRTAVIKEADIDKSYYMSRVVKVLNISAKKTDNGSIVITLPYLMPKRTSIDSDAYYHYELSEYIVKILEKMTNIQVMITSHNTNLLTNKIMRPDCYFILSDNRLVLFADATNRDLHKGHNLEKLYMRGEFGV